MGHWSEEKALTAQMAIAEVVSKTLGRCETQSKGDNREPKIATLTPVELR